MDFGLASLAHLTAKDTALSRVISQSFEAFR